MANAGGQRLYSNACSWSLHLEGRTLPYSCQFVCVPLPTVTLQATPLPSPKLRNNTNNDTLQRHQNTEESKGEGQEGPGGTGAPPAGAYPYVPGGAGGGGGRRY
jgi:hypothetical protein